MNLIFSTFGGKKELILTKIEKDTIFQKFPF